jgi:hypothetical protein
MRPGIKGILLGLLFCTACLEQWKAPTDTEADRNRDKAQPASPAGTRAVGLEARGEMTPADAAATPLHDARYDPAAATAMIIRAGTARLEIDSLETGIALLRALANRVGGYVASSDVQAGRDQPRSAVLQVKVPASRFDDLVNGVGAIGKLERVNVAAEDVGEEYTDVTARVANSRRLEQRLIELIASRTGKLSDVLEIERELARVREEIERMEGRLRYLKAHAAISTLSVTIHEPLPLAGEAGSAGVLAEALRQAWRNGVNFLAALIASLGVVVPLVLLGAAGLLGLRRAWRTRKVGSVTA